MNILVLGGDGYLGWPTALYLSRKGHKVGVVDNFARRGHELEMGVDSLVPIVGLQQRVRRWQEASGNEIDVFVGDLTDAEFVSGTLASFEPDTVVHFAEQRSAPYSMIDRKHAVYTQVNNVVGTLNLVYAMAEQNRDIHLVKLGTMGEFRVSNQFTESFSVQQMADKVAAEYAGTVTIEHPPTPRVEKEEHYYRAAHTKLLDLGLVPHLLTSSVIRSLLAVCEQYEDAVDPAAILPTVDWRSTSSRLVTAGSRGASPSGPGRSSSAEVG